MRMIYLQISVIAAAITLAACNDEGNEGEDITSLSALTGIYDWSDDFGGGIIDEYYLGIDSEGYLTSYNYDGDTFNKGYNCYHIDEDYDQITHLGGSEFESEDFGSFTVKRNGDIYTLTFTSQGGGIDELIKTSLTESDFTASDCALLL